MRMEFGLKRRDIDRGGKQLKWGYGTYIGIGHTECEMGLESYTI